MVSFNAPAAATARGMEPAGLWASASAPAVQFWGAFVFGGALYNHLKSDLHGMQESRYGALHAVHERLRGAWWRWMCLLQPWAGIYAAAAPIRPLYIGVQLLVRPM